MVLTTGKTSSCDNLSSAPLKMNPELYQKRKHTLLDKHPGFTSYLKPFLIQSTQQIYLGLQIKALVFFLLFQEHICTTCLDVFVFEGVVIHDETGQVFDTMHKPYLLI